MEWCILIDEYPNLNAKFDGIKNYCVIDSIT